MGRDQRHQQAASNKVAQNDYFKKKTLPEYTSVTTYPLEIEAEEGVPLSLAAALGVGMSPSTSNTPSLLSVAYVERSPKAGVEGNMSMILESPALQVKQSATSLLMAPGSAWADVLSNASSRESGNLVAYVERSPKAGVEGSMSMVLESPASQVKQSATNLLMAPGSAWADVLSNASSRESGDLTMRSFQRAGFESPQPCYDWVDPRSASESPSKRTLKTYSFHTTDDTHAAQAATTWQTTTSTNKDDASFSLESPHTLASSTNATIMLNHSNELSASTRKEKDGDAENNPSSTELSPNRRCVPRGNLNAMTGCVGSPKLIPRRAGSSSPTTSPRGNQQQGRSESDRWSSPDSECCEPSTRSPGHVSIESDWSAPSYRNDTSAHQSYDSFRMESPNMYGSQFYAGASPRVKQAEAAIQRTVKRGDWKQAVSLLQKMHYNGLVPTPRAYTSVISACGKAYMCDEAMWLFREMQAINIVPTAVTYNAIIHACSKSKKVDLAVKLLQEMQNNGVMPDVITYSVVMGACNQRYQWQRSLGLFREMKQAGIKADAITYSSAITACEKGGDYTHALQLLGEMQANGVQPDVVSYNATIAACEKSGKWNEALSLMEQMKKAGQEPDVVSYSASISACGKGGQWDKALKLLAKMKEDGIAPNVVSYSAAINACGKGAQWKQAVQLLSEMKENGVKPNVVSYSAAITACVRAVKWKQAMLLLRAMQEDGVKPDTVTYSACISACEKEGRWREALNLLQEMKDNHQEPDRITYNAVVSVLEMSGQKDKAVEMFREAYKKGMFKNKDIASMTQASVWELVGFPLSSARSFIRLMMTNFLEHLETERPLSGKPGDITIITGRGSPMLSAVLLPGITKMFAEEFSPALKTRAVPNNNGRIELTRASVDAWVAATRATGETHSWGDAPEPLSPVYDGVSDISAASALAAAAERD